MKGEIKKVLEESYKKFFYLRLLLRYLKDAFKSIEKAFMYYEKETVKGVEIKKEEIGFLFDKIKKEEIGFLFDKIKELKEKIYSNVVDVYKKIRLLEVLEAFEKELIEKKKIEGVIEVEEIEKGFKINVIKKEPLPPISINIGKAKIEDNRVCYCIDEKFLEDFEKIVSEKL